MAQRIETRRIALCLVLFSACAAAGCIRTLGEETSTSGRVVRDCEVPVPAGVAALGAPVSLEYEDGSLFVFGVLELEGGTLVANASAFVTDAEALCGTAPELRRAPDGSVASLLEKSPAENEHQATRTDGAQLWLIPTGGFVYEARGYLFYEHREGTSILASTSLGTGICVVEPGSTTCDRVEARGRTVLFPPEHALDQGGLVVGDHALILGCRVVADFTRLCTLSGAPLGSLTDPSTYAYWNGDVGWVQDARAASVVASELGTVTISAYLGGNLATSLDPFEGAFYVQRAPRATEPFGRRVYAFSIAANEAAFPSGGREHASLRRHPSEITVTYAVTRDEVSRLHLATFRFHGGALGDPYQPYVEGEGP